MSEGRGDERDTFDLIVLRQRLSDRPAVEALWPLDALYPQSGSSVTVEVVDRLAAAAPVDLADVELASYKGLVAPWVRWPHVAARGRLRRAARPRPLRW